MPERITRRRTKGWRAPEGAVNCTRPGPLGNPFKGDRAVELFEEWLAKTDSRDPEPHENVFGWDRAQLAFYFLTIRLKRDALRGRDLMCFCKQEDACHVDVILRWANKEK